MSDVHKIKKERKNKKEKIPSVAEPSVAEPSVAEPSVAEPSVAEPSVAEPSVAEPSVAEPSVAESSVAESSVAESSVAESSVAESSVAEPSVADESNTEVKLPKKRGRKPKGGKIIPNNFTFEANKSHEPNIIMHLKCGEMDLAQNTFINESNIQPVETFQFEKTNDLGYSVIDYGVKECGVKEGVVKDYTTKNDYNEFLPDVNEKKTVSNENDETRQMWGKLKELTYQLHTNSISDKKSACFWCTCDFDNPNILIPKFELNKMYHCYGCFCSPECATAYLFEEPIDTSTRFERYHLLNHIYCKIYNYEKNIKPAPNPYYLLNKYYGNLSIQEYRKLLKNERLLLVVDKPLSRVLPELHEDNDDYMFNGATISTSNKFKLRRKTKQTKTDILTDTFNLGGKPLGGNPTQHPS
jgi:hypothetical protein